MATLFTSYQNPLAKPAGFNSFKQYDFGKGFKIVSVLTIVFAMLCVAVPAWAEPAPAAPNRVGYWTSTGTNLHREESRVPFIQTEDLLDAIRSGRKVVFVDIREDFEFSKSHVPNARNIPFSRRLELIPEFKNNARGTMLVPYCNWDFRAYVAARDLKANGLSNVFMMYPHGLRGWIAQGLPHAGEEAGQSEEEAVSRLETVLRNPAQFLINNAESDPDARVKEPLRINEVNMKLFAKYTDPQHIRAKVGDKLVIHVEAMDEDHWFVVPDFGIEEHLEKGERRTVEMTIVRPGYFPFGCISCCTRYRCKTKQAILADLEEPTSYYGE